MIKKLLVANRAEIAVRVIRACRDLGIKTVAVYSVPDAGSLPVTMADEALCIGEAATDKSYLNVRNIITAACALRCDAIHPGVGFLSENASFAKQVEDAGLLFIGPRSETIALLGNKVAARRAALDAGIPITPGSSEALVDLADAKRIAKQIGYPVILKAAAGGGGRGMRIIESEDKFEQLFTAASSEALAAFGDGTMFLERFINNPRHIEVQVLGDSHGNAIHVGERDCSLQ
ncbi:MAG: biotin carboxylase N-terminal domain-containing protein, partial [Sphaerochaetaceae bacterium]